MAILQILHSARHDTRKTGNVQNVQIEHGHKIAFTGITIPLLLIIVALLHLLTGNPGNAMSSNGKNTDPDCLARYKIYRFNNPWKDLQEGFRPDDFRTLPAKTFPGENLKFFTHLSNYSLSGEQFIALDEEKQEIVINKSFFSKLKRGGATIIRKGDVQQIGFCRSQQLLKSPRKLIGFLLEAQIIRTYAHLESRLCLVREKNDGNIYEAELKGEHIYYTNRKNTGRLHFLISINLKSGKMLIRGL